MAGRGIDAERATRPLRDVAQMAQQDALRTFLYGLAERRARANAVREIRDVQRGHVVVGADVETVARPRGERLLDDLILEVIDDIPVAVHHHASGRAEDCGTALPAKRGEAVAALALPDDGLPAGDLEHGLLGVWELPVIVEVIAPSGRRHAAAPVHAQRPAADVDLVRPVVADLARAPAAEPMPVVVDHVVVVGGVRCRTLPQVVVEVRGDRGGLTPPDSASRVGVPGAGLVGLPDEPLANRLQDLDGARCRALLPAHLYGASVLALRLY